MALPPIVTNSPLYKAITGSQDKKTAGQDSGGASALKPESKDTIKLSAEALGKLQAEALKSENTARETARDVGQSLAKNPKLSLSKDGQGLDAA
ncbi:MAG: hypothetical protein JWO78_1529 [Micavibrio sp.]|nr:hypothetical protein [Micavibrio sp.]